MSLLAGGATKKSGAERTLNSAAIAEYIFIASLGIILGTGFLLFWHAVPLADDFYRAVESRQLGIWPSLRSEYVGWTGRWAGALIELIATRFAVTFRFYPLVILPFALVMAAAVYRFAGAVLGAAPARLLVAITASFICFYFSRMPGPGETFYWLTGAAENQFGLSLYLLVLAALLRASNSNRAPGIAKLLLLFLGTIFAAGTHELYALMFVIVTAAGAFLAFQIRSRSARAWTVATLAAVVGFLIVYVAPGNRVREATLANHGNLRVALFVGIAQGKSYLLWWTQNFALWIATLLFLSHPAVRGAHPRWTSGWVARWWPVVPTAYVLILAGGFFGPSWAMGYEMAPRTANAIYFCFLLGWMLTAFVLTRPGGPFAAFRLNWVRFRPWLLVGFAIAILTGPDIGAAVRDALRRSDQYAAEMHRRDDLLANARRKGQLDVQVPPIRVWPPSYPSQGVGELAGNSDYWVNESVAEYSGLRSVKLKSPAPDSQVSPDKGSPPN